MKILMLGDVVGSPGRRIIKEKLAGIRKELGLAAVIANAENADAITMGDHTWGQKEFAPTIGQLQNLVRPANFAPEAPGKGWRLITTPICRFAVLNLHGRVFMQPVDCPFHAADAALREIPKDVPVFVDFHAEATSEKITLAHYLDGRVTAVVGTHTHVQTSDAIVLPGGTAFITDLGMTGPWYSSIGRQFEPVTQKLMTGIPARFEVATGPATLEGAVITFDSTTRKATSITPFRYREPLK